jgi:ArsR family metal-binding transcriptional regulator
MKKEYKEYIEKLEHKLDYYQKLDRKNILAIIKMQRVITNYETNFIEYYRYEELQNDYINLVQVLNNKNKEANNDN